MKEKMKELTGLHIGLIAIAGALVAFCLVAVTVSGIYLLTRDRGGNGSKSNPVLIDPSTDGSGDEDGSVAEVAVGLPGGGG